MKRALVRRLQVRRIKSGSALARVRVVACLILCVAAGTIYADLPGSSCSLPQPAVCNDVFDAAHPVPGSAPVALPCAGSYVARWVQVNIPAHSWRTIRVQTGGNTGRVGVTWYADCRTPALNEDVSLAGRVTSAHSNSSAEDETVLVRVTTEVSVDEPTIEIACPEQSGSGCGAAAAVANGATFLSGTSELPGHSLDLASSLGEANPAPEGHWLTLDVPAKQILEVSATAPQPDCAISVFGSCGDTAPLSAVAGGSAGVTSLRWSNPRTVSTTVYVLLNVRKPYEVHFSVSGPPTAAGSSCDNTVLAGCDGLVASPQAGDDRLPGYIAHGAQGRWLTVQIPAMSQATVSAAVSDGSVIALGEYVDCVEIPVAVVNGQGVASSPLTNATLLELSRLVLVNSIGSAGAPVISIECAALPGATCATAVAADCGGRFAANSAVGQTIPGAVARNVNCSQAPNLIGHWLRVGLAPGEGISFHASDTNASHLVGVALYPDCAEPDQPLDCAAANGNAELFYENASAESVSLLVLVNHTADSTGWSVEFGDCASLAGGSEANALQANCADVFDESRPVPGAGSDRVACFTPGELVARWITFDVAAGSIATVAVQSESAAAIAFYRDGVLISSACGSNEALLSYTNSGEAPVTLKALIDTVSGSVHPIIAVDCLQLQGNSCSTAVSAACGDVFAPNGAVGRQINAVATEFPPCVTETSGLQSHWIQIVLPPGGAISATLHDPQATTPVGIAAFDECGESLPEPQLCMSSSVEDPGAEVVLPLLNHSSVSKRVWVLFCHNEESPAWTLVLGGCDLQSGGSCTAGTIAVDGAIFDSAHPIAGASAASIACFGVPETAISRFIRVQVPPRNRVVITAETAPGSPVGLAAYSSCFDATIETRCETGVTNVSLVNDSNVWSEYPIQITNSATDGHPIVTVDCAPLPPVGASCSTPYHVISGAQLSAANPIAGSAALSNSVCLAGLPDTGRWIEMEVPAGVSANVAVVDTQNRSVGVGFSDPECNAPRDRELCDGCSAELNFHCATGYVTSSYSNSGTSAKTILARVDSASASPHPDIFVFFGEGGVKGWNCFDPVDAPIGSLFTPSNPITGGVAAPYCSIGSGTSLYRARWMKVPVAAGQEIRVSISDEASNAIRLFETCGGLPAAENCLSWGDSITYMNSTGAAKDILAVVLTQGTGHPSIRVDEADTDTSGWSPFQPMIAPCGTQFSAQNPVPGFTAYRANGITTAIPIGRWIKVPVDGNTRVDVHVTAPNTESQVGVHGWDYGNFPSEFGEVGNGEITYSDTNRSVSPWNFLFFVSSEEGTHPNIDIICSPIPGSSCAASQHMECGEVFDDSRSIDGYEIRNISCGGEGTARWLNLEIPPFTIMQLSCAEAYGSVAVQAYNQCTDSVPFVSDCGEALAAVDIANSTGSPRVVYAVATNSSGSMPTIASGCMPAPLQVISINRLEASPTNASTLGFQIAFSQPVTGVALSAFSVRASAGVTGTLSSCVQGANPSLYVVTVADATGEGALAVDLSTVTGIQDVYGNALASGFSTGESYTLDHVSPTVGLGTPSSMAVNAASQLQFPVTYQGASTVNLAPASVQISTTGNVTIGNVSVLGGTTLTPTMKLTGVQGNGQLTVQVAAGTATDLAGNSAGASAVSQSVTVDNIVPQYSWVSIAKLADQPPVNLPLLVSRGTVVEIQIGCSEPMSVNPTLQVNGRPATLQSSTAGVLKYTYATGSLDPMGVAVISISGGADNAGNAGTAATFPDKLALGEAGYACYAPADIQCGSVLGTRGNGTPAETMITQNALDAASCQPSGGFSGKWTRVVLPAFATATLKATDRAADNVTWQAEDFTGDANPIAGLDYADYDPGNIGNQYRPYQNVDIGYADNYGYTVAWTTANEWTRYGFNANAGTFTWTVRYSNGAANQTTQATAPNIRLLWDNGAILGTLWLPTTKNAAGVADWGKYETTSTVVTIPSGGFHYLKLATITANGGNYDWFNLRRNSADSIASPARFEMENYSLAYDTNPASPTAPQLGTGEGSAHLTSTAKGEWTEYPVTVAGGYYRWAVRYANGGPATAQLRLYVDGIFTTELTLPVTGDWGTFKEAFTYANIPFSGPHSLRIETLSDTGGNYNWFRLDPDVGALNIPGQGALDLRSADPVAENLTWQAEDFTGGLSPISGLDYFDLDPTNQGNAYRLNQGVDLGGSGGFALGWSRATEWTRYPFYGPAGTYTWTLRYSNGNAGQTTAATKPVVQLRWDNDAVLGTLSLPTTVNGSGVADWGTNVLTTTTVTIPTSGFHYLKLYTSSSGSTMYGGNYEWFNLRLNASSSIALATRIEMENYSSAQDTNPGTPNAAQTAAGDGGTVLAYTAKGEWTQYQVSLGSGYYRWLIRYANGLATAAQVRLYVDGSFATDLTLPTTGGWGTFSEAYTFIHSPSSGAHALRIETLTDAGANYNWFFLDPSSGMSPFIQRSHLLNTSIQLYSACATPMPGACYTSASGVCQASLTNNTPDPISILGQVSLPLYSSDWKIELNGCAP